MSCNYYFAGCPVALLFLLLFGSLLGLCGWVSLVFLFRQKAVCDHDKSEESSNFLFALFSQKVLYLLKVNSENDLTS